MRLKQLTGRSVQWMALLLLLSASMAPAAASAHPGHSHGPASFDGRLPGQPDFVRKGKTTYRFLPGKEEYEIRTEGRPAAFAHVDYLASLPNDAGAEAVLPTYEDAPICRTSGHRIVPVFTHRPGAGGPTPTAQIQSIVQRMNWKIRDQASQSSGGSRPLEMVVDCTAGGVIQVYDVATADNEIATIDAAVSAQLYGKPEGTDSVKYLVFEDTGTNAGIATSYSDPGKVYDNANAVQSGIAITYSVGWDAFAGPRHIAVHEIFHTIGASQGASDEPPPFSSPGGHCFDGYDVLCYRDGSGPIGSYTMTRCPASEGYEEPVKVPIDCQKDTYFDAVPSGGSWLATHWNSGGEENPFLINENDLRLQAETGQLATDSQTTVSGVVTTNSTLEAKYRFEYGTTKSYGSVTSWTNVAADEFGKEVQQSLTGLTPGVEYHYRLAAQNSKGTAYGADRAFVVSKWKRRQTPGITGTAALEDVSCSGKHACTAVGARLSDIPVALRTVDGEWVQQTMPNPEGGALEGVSCPTATFCMAVGPYYSERWNGSSWTVDSPPLPSGLTGSVELHGVSCTSSSFCVAVGRYEASVSKTLVVAWNGSTWSIVSSPNPAGSNELRSVSCVSTSSCVAVGTTESSAVLVERWNGTSWSLDSTSTSSGENTLLEDVSCPSASACTAVGKLKGNRLALAWNGTKWNDVSPAAASGSFDGVSCLSGTACYALDGKGASSWNGSSWTAEPFGEPFGLRDLACWSTTSCVAAGNSFDAALNKFVPVIEQRSPYGPPIVSTDAVTGLELQGTIDAKATLNATVNPAGTDASYYFQYGTTSSYGSKAPAVAKELTAGETGVKVSQAIEGLGRNITYHYRIVAYNESGINKGEDRVFTTLDTMPIKALSFGSTGAGDGQFAFPRGIAVDAQGNVWVADGNNDRIQKFNESGEYLGKFGSSGTGNGQFDTPVDIAITAGGDLWVTDAFNCRVQKFDSTGKYLDQFGTCGLGDGEFAEPSGIAIAPDGHIWVTDHLYDRVEEFDASGEFLQSVYGGNGGFFAPQGIAIGSDGHIWVADGRNNRVQELSPEGDYLSEFGTYGTGPGQFAEAVEIDITPSGRIWVADRETGRVQAFNTSGHYLGTVGSFFEPAGLTAGPDGSVYVSDSRNDRVQKWAAAIGPQVQVLPAQGVTSNQAELRGKVNPRAFPTTYYFQYGKTTSYGTKVPIPAKSAGAGSKFIEVGEVIGSLTPGTIYHYQISAENAGGSPKFSEDKTFETPPTPLHLAAMATTKAFDGSSASLADFSANWSTLGWASGANAKGADTSTGWRVVDVNPIVNGAFFNPSIADTGPGIAAVATMSANPFYAGRYFSLWLDMANPSAATRSGYELRLTYVGANTFDVALSKWQSGTQTVLASKAGYEFPVGSSLALADKGGTVSAWTKTGSEFTQLLTAEDTAFVSGNVGLEGAGNLIRLTNFKTGPLVNAVASMDAALKGLQLNDSFETNETPLSGGGAWAALAWANGTSGNNTGRILSGWSPFDAFPTINGAFWAKSSFAETGAGVAAAVRLTTKFSSSSGRYFSLWLHMPSPASARTGYELRFVETSPAVYDVTLSKWQAGSQTTLATKTGYAFALGSYLALVDKGNTVSVWTNTSSAYSQLLSAEDSAFISGYSGIEASGNSGRVKEFRSGPLAPF